MAGNADEPDGVVFTDTQGRTIAACGTPVPVTSVEAGVASIGLGQTKWVHPSGERLNPKFVYFNEPTDAACAVQH